MVLRCCARLQRDVLVCSDRGGRQQEERILPEVIGEHVYDARGVWGI